LTFKEFEERRRRSSFALRDYGLTMVTGGWWLVAGGWWLVAGGWWLVAGGWWLVAGGWWLVAGNWWPSEKNEGNLLVLSTF
jgi:hypothetical protein